jgi:sugar transferase (PEP-CTERM/EpsH1 system associated)
MTDILFLAHRIPFPPDRGDKIRSWHLLRHLAGFGRVHLACFADDAADAAHLAALREMLGDRLGEVHVEVRKPNLVGALHALGQRRPLSLALFDSAAMRAFVDTILASVTIDTIVAFSGQMGQFVPERIGARFIMDFVDVDSAKFEAYGQAALGPKRWIYRREARRLLAFERATAVRADASLFVSEAEARLFQKLAKPMSGGNVVALGNGIDLDFYRSDAGFRPLTASERGGGPLILFTGQMDYRPNAEAVTAFARDAMPRILAVRPDARFAIVGRNPGAAVRRLDGRNGVIVTGAVADVRSWLAAAEVVVAPLLMARGIQNKVLEAMAMARPVVASPAAFEGIDAEPGRDLIVARGSDRQAAAVLALLGDDERRQRIGTDARRRVEDGYGWDARLAPLAEIVGLSSRRAAA